MSPLRRARRLSDTEKWWWNGDAEQWFFEKKYKQVVSLALLDHHMSYKMTSNEIYAYRGTLPVEVQARGKVVSADRQVQQMTAYQTRMFTADTVKSWLEELKVESGPLDDPVQTVKECIKAKVRSISSSNHKLGYTSPFLKKLPLLRDLHLIAGGARVAGHARRKGGVAFFENAKAISGGGHRGSVGCCGILGQKT